MKEIIFYDGKSSLIVAKTGIDCHARKIMRSFLITFILFSLPFSMKAQELKTVAQVDLDRYTGKWYEIASYPMIFQKGCHCTTATYTKSPKGFVIVENRCNKGSVDGPESYIKGKAFVAKNSGNAKLKVQFFWPFRANYWIIDLAEDYSYAVVSDPGRSTLWILSRTPEMDQEVYDAILEKLEDWGFDLSRLRRTIQSLPAGKV